MEEQWSAGAYKDVLKGKGGGHTVSNNIVMVLLPQIIVGLLKKRISKGGSWAPQDPLATPLVCRITQRLCHEKHSKEFDQPWPKMLYQKTKKLKALHKKLTNAKHLVSKETVVLRQQASETLS